MPVSLFPSTMPDPESLKGGKNEAYRHILTPMRTIPLSEFLSMGNIYGDVIARIRMTDDKDERGRLKLRKLPCATISATFGSRSRDIPLEERLMQYNSLMVLDFDGVADVEDSKKRLADVPYIYYAGLSVSGKGLFAIVPLDTDDYRMHKVFFEALQDEMLQMGFVVDKACSDVTRLRVLSYDPAPYVNEDCEVFVLPDNDSISAPDPGEDEPEEIMGSETDTAGQVARYVDVWEKKEIPLDDTMTGARCVWLYQRWETRPGHTLTGFPSFLPGITGRITGRSSRSLFARRGASAWEHSSISAIPTGSFPQIRRIMKWCPFPLRFFRRLFGKSSLLRMTASTFPSIT